MLEKFSPNFSPIYLISNSKYIYKYSSLFSYFPEYVPLVFPSCYNLRQNLLAVLLSVNLDIFLTRLARALHFSNARGAHFSIYTLISPYIFDVRPLLPHSQLAQLFFQRPVNHSSSDALAIPGNFVSCLFLRLFPIFFDRLMIPELL